MEAVACDHCGRAQPVDWRPDDACIHCGHAARRQSRCPWCTRLVPGRFCRHCGCALVDAADYGVARMLFAAGVDRLSLVERLDRLDPAQREVLASRFAAQRACVAMRVEEARACEAHLATRGWAAALEEELVRWLPVPGDTAWLVPGAGGEPDPAQVFATTALAALQQLAALACVRLGTASREAIELCRGLAERDEPLALEAALAISGWRARRARWLDLRRGRNRTARLAEALARPELAPEAAVCLALDQVEGPYAPDPDALAPLLPRVRDALAAAARDDVRLGAALVLADDTHLGDALARSDADDELRDAALAALARAQSRLVIELLADGDAARLAAAPGRAALGWDPRGRARPDRRR